MLLSPLHTEADCFVDSHGRQVILRGVNLGGDSKVPYPDGGTQHPSDFANHRTVSFVGRPCPLAEADEHLARLQHWGFNCLRLLTTWEAVEHAGPGEYDHAYLDYLEALCGKAALYGLYIFIDFHQDVWSRMSGGDGAPGWTFEKVGLDFTRLDAAGAAHVMQHRFNYQDPSHRQDSYPQMSWASNYRMPANGILWTLFWAGRTLTPEFCIDGINVQEYLQSHLLGAMGVLAERLRDMPHVIGFDTLNEPGIGWLGQMLSPVVLNGEVQTQSLAMPGPLWSPLEALSVARGLPTTLAVLSRDPHTGLTDTKGRQLVNPQGVSIWRDGMRCPFEQAGIYRVEGGCAVALREDAFTRVDGQALDISEHAFGPFFHRVANTVRSHRKDWLLFAEIDPFGVFTGRQFPRDMPAGTVNASHWYDLALLVTKHFDSTHSPDMLSGEIAQGPDAIRRRFVRQLSAIKQLGHSVGHLGAPLLLGEFGIPFDLDDGSAYSQWAQGQRDTALWHDHTQALRLMYDAIDALHLSSTQWNYTAGNRNDLRVGDQWNQEDLSIYSADQCDDVQHLDSGARAIHGFCRPYVRAVQGRLLLSEWRQDRRVFRLVFTADPSLKEPTEIYLPNVQFPNGFEILLNGVSAQCVEDPTKQLALIHAAEAGTISVYVQEKPESSGGLRLGTHNQFAIE